MRVLHVTGEVGPFSKTGGLGDVLEALPLEQQRAGLDVRVLTPRYGFIERFGAGRPGPLVELEGGRFESMLYDAPTAPVTFVDVPGLLDRPEPYADYPDNPLRFAVFCKVAAALRDEYDLLHLHDWQAALTALYLQGARPTIQTIHNLAYQGQCSLGWAAPLGIKPELLTWQGLEFHGGLNLLKAGLVFADRLTTVSPRYAREICDEPGGQGLSGLFRHRARELTGILNGIDPVAWDPTTDAALPARFGPDDTAGKATCKAALCAELGLADGPLLGIVSRAVGQKGLDLVAEAAPALIGAGARFAVLADGERWLMDHLQRVADQHRDGLVLVSRFDLALARRIYAGSDYVLVPSRFEPCGLTQMFGMRYGAVPVVRATGGLADTVEDEVTGITFHDPTPADLTGAVHRALDRYREPDRYRAMQREGMVRDWSWARAAEAYHALYRALLEE